MVAFFFSQFCYFPESSVMGFDVTRFQGDVDEELLCPICSEVLEDPLQVYPLIGAFMLWFVFAERMAFFDKFVGIGLGEI